MFDVVNDLLSFFHKNQGSSYVTLYGITNEMDEVYLKSTTSSRSYPHQTSNTLIFTSLNVDGKRFLLIDLNYHKGNKALLGL